MGTQVKPTRSLDGSRLRTDDRPQRTRALAAKRGESMVGEREPGDEALVLTYKQTSDRAALETLITHYWPHTFHIAQQILNNTTTTKNTTQKTIMALAHNTTRFEKKQPFDPWFQTLI